MNESTAVDRVRSDSEQIADFEAATPDGDLLTPQDTDQSGMLDLEGDITEQDIEEESAEEAPEEEDAEEDAEEEGEEEEYLEEEDEEEEPLDDSEYVYSSTQVCGLLGVNYTQLQWARSRMPHLGIRKEKGHLKFSSQDIERFREFFATKTRKKIRSVMLDNRAAPWEGHMLVVRLPAGLKRDVQKLAVLRNTTISYIVRQALGEFLAKSVGGRGEKAQYPVPPKESIKHPRVRAKYQSRKLKSELPD